MIQRALTCDECYGIAENADGIVLGVRATSARVQAHDVGWHQTTKGRDLCPECWEEGLR